MDVFQECSEINTLLTNSKDFEARNQLIQLLDYHEAHQVPYTPLLNHLIRITGLYPYMDLNTSGWEDIFVYNSFKVDVGGSEKMTLHREQSFLLKKLLDGINVAVSAPTSFGKSFVIDAYIAIKKPKNVFIIVPTLALTDETRRRIYSKYASEYKIITTTDVDLAEKNIFIFPQERAINYLDVVDEIDILIVDEFYKASSLFDKDRSPNLIKSIIKLGSKAKQKYFLSPNISSISENPFTKGMEFIPLDFNTVFLKQHELYKAIGKDDILKNKALLEILEIKKTKTLIYAGTYSNIDNVSDLLMLNQTIKDKTLLIDFSSWLEKNYDVNWSLTNLIKRGIGIHNGKLHRSISQIQVKLFEELEGIDTMISTSSIIEGVNTSAENVVIWMNKNGRSRLNDFTYKNIIGRGGRMFKYFVGQIYILDAPPLESEIQLDLPFPEEILGDLDDEIYQAELTKEQMAKIVVFKDEMNDVFGEDEYEKLKKENIFQNSNSDFIKKIAIDIKNNQSDWNGLNYLNSSNVDNWDRMLYKIIRLDTKGWESKFSDVVSFVKILRNNWTKTIPELLKDLEPFDIDIEGFFKLERNITFKLTSMLKDVNVIQKSILKHKNYDITKFINYCASAFLPKTVYQLEEFGLPRMISRKIQDSGIIDFHDNEVDIHSALGKFNDIGYYKLNEALELNEFDKYILQYFLKGIEV